MGTLYDMPAFYRWLADAQDSELIARRALLVDVLVRLQDPNVVADARHLLRKIDEELLARQLR